MKKLLLTTSLIALAAGPVAAADLDDVLSCNFDGTPTSTELLTYRQEHCLSSSASQTLHILEKGKWAPNITIPM